jgi:hypothetical protein
MKSRQQRQYQQLVAALQEKRDADAAWLAAKREDQRIASAPTVESRRRLDDLWQRCEHAHDVVSQLRWVDFGVLDGSRSKGVGPPPL